MSVFSGAVHAAQGGFPGRTFRGDRAKPHPPGGISKPIPMGAAGLLSGELLLDLLELFLLGLLGRVPAFGCHFLVDIVLHGQRIL